MTTNRKFTQKVNSHCFKLHRSYSISLNLSNVGEIFWIELERTLSEFRKKKKETFCVSFTYSVKGARENRKFLVLVEQGWLKNVQKSVVHVQSCCFTNIRRTYCFFCRSPSLLPKLPIGFDPKVLLPWWRDVTLLSPSVFVLLFQLFTIYLFLEAFGSRFIDNSDFESLVQLKKWSFRTYFVYFQTFSKIQRSQSLTNSHRAWAAWDVRPRFWGTMSLTWDQAPFSCRFVNNIPAGKAKLLAVGDRQNVWEPLKLGLISGYSLRSKRFRLVSEQRKTEEQDSRFWSREKWNKSQKMKVGGGEGEGRKRLQTNPLPALLLTPFPRGLWLS